MQRLLVCWNTSACNDLLYLPNARHLHSRKWMRRPVAMLPLYVHGSKPGHPHPNPTASRDSKRCLLAHLSATPAALTGTCMLIYLLPHKRYMLPYSPS